MNKTEIAIIEKCYQAIDDMAFTLRSEATLADESFRNNEEIKALMHAIGQAKEMAEDILDEYGDEEE